MLQKMSLKAVRQQICLMQESDCICTGFQATGALQEIKQLMRFAKSGVHFAIESSDKNEIYERADRRFRVKQTHASSSRKCTRAPKENLAFLFLLTWSGKDCRTAAAVQNLVAMTYSERHERCQNLYLLSFYPSSKACLRYPEHRSI